MPGPSAAGAAGAGALAAVGAESRGAASQLPALVLVTFGCWLLPSELYSTVRVQPFASVVDET
jgi:hypothetical protein